MASANSQQAQGRPAHRKLKSRTHRSCPEFALALSPVHVLATVGWGAPFEKTGERLIEFDSSYLLEKTEDSWKILSYITPVDQTDEMRRAGVL